MSTPSRLYPDRRTFVAHQPRFALSTCEHGLTLADCELCTRYAGECDLGGCIRPATGYGINRDTEGNIRERRLVCSDCADFARSLGMEFVSVDQAADHYDELPDYEHVQWCQWAHIWKWCPLGCHGEPSTYETAIAAAGLVAS